MIIREEKWQNIPLLHIVEDEFETKEIPTVIFFHGFTSAKEHNLHYAYNLAKKGIRVLLPDSHLHGSRGENLDEVELALRFWEIVITNIEELKVLRETLLEKGLISTEKIGVGGTSMGGITTLGALKIYDWISASTVMMGAPGFVELAKAQVKQFEKKGFKIPISKEERAKLFEHLAIFDLTKAPEALKGRPVYFWHGKNDPVVPYRPTYQFYEQTKELYEENPMNFVFDVDETASHSVTRAGMLAAVNWMSTHLNE